MIEALTLAVVLLPLNIMLGNKLAGLLFGLPGAMNRALQRMFPPRFEPFRLDGFAFAYYTRSAL